MINTANTQQQCDHPTCQEMGEFRAPVAPNKLRDYHWFCLIHVREYNAAWNYCKGMGSDQIEAMTRDANCWGRPTWPMGMQGGGKNTAFGQDGINIQDDFDIYPDGNPNARKTNNKQQRQQQDQWDENGTYPDNEIRLAYDLLGLKPPVVLTHVKSRYKELVKQLHPDVNGQDPHAEEQLKLINHAYSILRKNLQGQSA